jgi:hypothetical protein
MTRTNRSPALLVAAAAVAVAIGAMPATAGDREHAVAHAYAVQSDDASAVWIDDGTVIEVKVTDGDVGVLIDGEPIPQWRIKKKENGRLVILDENGDEMRSLGLLGFAGEGGNLSFAMPGPEPKVMLGLYMGAPSAALRHHLRLDEGAATMITGIYQGLPAHDAGLELYDVIVAVDGQVPADPESIRAALAELEPGAEVTLTVIQEGRTREFNVRVDAFDRQRFDEAELIGGQRQIFSQITIPGMKGQKFEFRPDQFVDPQTGDVFREWRKWIEDQSGARPQWNQRVPEDLDDRLENLDERVDEIRNMLDMLIEQHRRSRERQGER